MTYTQEREFISLFEALESQITDVEFEYAMEADGEDDTKTEISEATADAKKGLFKKALGKLRGSTKKIKDDIQSKDKKRIRRAKVLLTLGVVALLGITTAYIVYLKKTTKDALKQRDFAKHLKNVALDEMDDAHAERDKARSERDAAQNEADSVKKNSNKNRSNLSAIYDMHRSILTFKQDIQEEKELGEDTTKIERVLARKVEEFDKFIVALANQIK